MMKRRYEGKESKVRVVIQEKQSQGFGRVVYPAA